MKLKHILFPVTLTLSACGPEVVDPSASSEAALIGLSPKFKETAQLRDVRVRRAAERAGSGVTMPLHPPRGLPSAPPQPRLVEWTRSAHTLRDFSGELFFYREALHDQPVRLFKVRFLGGELLKEEAFDPVTQLWAQVEQPNRRVLGEALRAPVSLRSGERNIVVEVDECELRAEHGVYECLLSELASVSMYSPKGLAPGDPAPQSLACLEHCPNPSPSPQGKGGYFFVMDQDAYRLDVSARLIKYTYNSRDLLLLQDEVPVRAPASSDGRMMSGFMFEYSAENLDAMACDLDGDGRREESCAHLPLDVFYTYATDHNLPVRGLIEQ